jgi:hypothetical protein
MPTTEGTHVNVREDSNSKNYKNRRYATNSRAASSSREVRNCIWKPSTAGMLPVRARQRAAKKHSR